MPYINKELRPYYDDFLNGLDIPGPGQLNYLITKLMQRYLDQDGGVSYSGINDVVGALESAKAEFQRRVVAPYEDKKIKENGDL